MPALGDEFRSAREARGLTLSDVAEQIHIRSVYLAAIETEDWAAIGAPVYARGFLRTYARFLGLDGEAAVQAFNETVPAQRDAPTLAAAAVETERGGPSVWAVVAGLVAVLLVAFVAYEWWQFQAGAAGPRGAVAVASPAAQPTAAALGSPLPTAPPTAIPTPAPRHQLELRLSQTSWLRVAVDGHTVLEGLYPAGTVKKLTGNVAYVRVGNAGGVAVSVDGSSPKVLGKDGDVVEERYTL